MHERVRPVTEWDARFAEPDYAYGTEPNAFLAAVACNIPRGGPVLCLAEGQGRNATFLARQGYRVTAVDQSSVGLARAHELAARQGVQIECIQADLAEYHIEPGAWSGIVSIFVHLPATLRAHVYRGAATGLRPGGVIVVEAYAPRQLTFNTGGPRTVERLVPRGALVAELEGLDFLLAQEAEREVFEGKYHKGMAAVVQVLARKPGG